MIYHWPAGLEVRESHSYLKRISLSCKTQKWQKWQITTGQPDWPPWLNFSLVLTRFKLPSGFTSHFLFYGRCWTMWQNHLRVKYVFFYSQELFITPWPLFITRQDHGSSDMNDVTQSVSENPNLWSTFDRSVKKPFRNKWQWSLYMAGPELKPEECLIKVITWRNMILKGIPNTLMKICSGDTFAGMPIGVRLYMCIKKNAFTLGN